MLQCWNHGKLCSIIQLHSVSEKLVYDTMNLQNKLADNKFVKGQLTWWIAIIATNKQKCYDFYNH